MPIRYSSVVGGSSGSGFNLDVGSSGNTTFTFSEAQPAGGYSITSQLTDATIEFYAIAEDGSLAGYTNTKALAASQDFTKIVIYGATNNDLLTFEFKPTTLPTGNGDQDSGAAPFVTSVSNSDLASLDDTTIITGGNFATDVVVTFTGTDNVVRNAKSIVRTDSTQLIITRPDDFLEDNSPYTLEVSNPGIPQSAIVTSVASITAGSDPVWSTPSGLINGYLIGSSVSVNLSAADAESSVSYSLLSGSLPAGLSLNSSTGEIFGSPTQNGSYVFVIGASDAEGNVSNREFEIEISSLPLASGGTLQNIDNYNIHTFNSNGTLSVSESGTVEYLVVAGGGAGGFDVGGGGGAGGMLVGSLFLSTGDYSVTVGAGGSKNTSTGGRGGDGAGSSLSNLVQASGGGGGGNYGPGGGGNGGQGGSGGGAAGYAAPSSPGQGIDGQGNDGGPRTLGGDSTLSGSGGGGAGGVGSAAAYFSGRNGAVDGGPGLPSSISGSAIIYAAGGKGGADSWMTGVTQPDADPNTGNGGNGDGQSPGNPGGANGGSGIVIIRYPS